MTDTQRPFLQLAFIGDRNRPGKSDWSGAFKPEAMRYTESAGILHIMSLAQSRETQRQTIEENIARVQPDEVAFFCHGYALKLELGYDTSNVGRLADALAKVGCHRVALYACSTGGHRTKGFAARLRDAMCEAGLDPRIVAHETAGHTTMNPRKRLFTAPAGSPGADIVERKSPLWSTWVKRLRDVGDPLRFSLLAHDAEAIRSGLA